MPSHVAKNIIVGLDFDGTIAYGAQLRVWYAKKFYGINLTVQQILGETWPKELGKEKYRQMADAVVKRPKLKSAAKNFPEVTDKLA